MLITKLTLTCRKCGKINEFRDIVPAKITVPAGYREQTMQMLRDDAKDYGWDVERRLCPACQEL